MRELDELLTAWLSLRYDTASAGQRERFTELLALPDPQLQRYLLAGERPGSTDSAALVDAILDAKQIMSSQRRGNLPGS